jgi:hypothetical protein
VRDISLRFAGAVASDTLMVGTSATVIAEARDVYGRLLGGRKITLGVADSTRATMDAAGKITGLSVGFVDVIARYDSVERHRQFVVRPPFAAKLTVRMADPKKFGDTTWAGLRDTALVTFADASGQALAVSPFRPVSFTVDNPALASVDSLGRVRFLSVGTVTIRAAGDGLVAAKSVTVVRAPVVQIIAAPDTVRLGPGDDAAIRPILVDGGGLRTTTVTGHTLTYQAQTPGVATVDGQGNVHGVAVGTASVLVTSDRGKTSVPVKVVGPSAQGAFHIKVRFIGPTPTQEVQDAFAAAQSRWENVVRETTDTLHFNWTKGTCGSTDSTHVENVADVVIMARIDSIDGSGNILGSAGPCILKQMPSGRYMPAIGRMTFDSADMSYMATKGLLKNVIAHEMAHVLGIGTMWSARYNNSKALAVQGSIDPEYFGPAGMGAAAGMGFTGFSVGTDGLAQLDPVPLEDTGGAGTAGSHWRRSVFGNELMIGWASSSTMPLSLLTLQAIADLGYTVNTSAAEAWGTFILGGAASNYRGVLGQYLGTEPVQLNERLETPEFTADRTGRLTRVRQ